MMRDIVRRHNMNYSKALFFALLFLVASGITLQTSAQQADDASAASELWGGKDIQMNMDSQGATLQFPCADGKILEPIKAASNGEFTARGTYTPGQFGPIRKDNPPRELPAVYKGTLSGNTMHLQIVLSDKSLQPPPVTLSKGKAGRVVRCH
jgi:hypothetical protein